MRNNNLLTLHEAIAVVILKYPKWQASFEKIANDIQERGLYTDRKGGVELDKQCFLRTKNYPQLFELVSKDLVQLRYNNKAK